MSQACATCSELPTNISTMTLTFSPSLISERERVREKKSQRKREPEKKRAREKESQREREPERKRLRERQTDTEREKDRKRSENERDRKRVCVFRVREEKKL